MSHLENTRRVWKDRKPDPDIALEEEYLQVQVRLAQAKRKNKRKKVLIEELAPACDRLLKVPVLPYYPSHTNPHRFPRRQDPPRKVSRLLCYPLWNMVTPVLP